MITFNLSENGNIADIVCETAALEGVRRISDTVADDICLVTGKKPEIRSSPGSCRGGSVIVFATVGCSALLDSPDLNSLIDTSSIAGKRECFMMTVLQSPFAGCPDIRQALFVIGSDKRGTIYGMFRLSELCGVSPLVFWGDAAPVKKDSIALAFDGDIVTKEPSVKYRGFFINDEWPAFGNWCTDRYGDVNAEAYDEVFKLLLRLKGNYLWPAMWNSSFSEDGPGPENARLADIYGVIMGASHHEPMNRAGVEWQRQYKNYGDDNTWSFVTNSKAITEFWKDGIIRNRDFENIITIGMRGENDSLLMGENATIQDNINVLKNAITTQNRLIKEHINPDLGEVPRMFAIYKEVEDFYFGDGGCGGLDGWDELNDVILLFSDDNHGNLRAIPRTSEKTHSGGYGMYYHFDYHGGPVSYEWLGHTNPAKTWEQLTMAYEHGIREMWIVNAGDIKGNEYPLSFFMNLAYDYDKWGISNLNSAHEFTCCWIDTQFGNMIGADRKNEIHDLLRTYTTLNTVRIPESLNPDVFMNDFAELDLMHAAVQRAVSRADSLRGSMPQCALNAYSSMIYYPVKAFLSSMLVNLTAGMNHLHAKRGALIANRYASELQNAIMNERAIIGEFHDFLGGKWNHMMESAHMCFRTWDDNDWTYPAAQIVTPIPQPKIVVSFSGSSPYSLGFHWHDRNIICSAVMTRPDINDVIINIDSRGEADFSYAASCDKPWLSLENGSGSVTLSENPRAPVLARCDRSMLRGEDTALVRIDFEFGNKAKKHALMKIRADNTDYSRFSGAFLESEDYICIHADNYAEVSDINGEGWRPVPRLGRFGNAMKSFPVTRNWEKETERPYACYDFLIRKAGEHIITFYVSPRNPLYKGAAIKGCFSINGGAPQIFDIIGSPGSYTAGDAHAEWGLSVLNNIRKIKMPVSFNAGLNSIKLYAANPNAIFEDIVIYPSDKPIPETHLAPPESFRIP